MPFPKKKKKIDPKLYFTLKSGKYIMVPVEDAADAETIMKRWDEQVLRASIPEAAWFTPTDTFRLCVSDVAAVAYVGPEEE